MISSRDTDAENVENREKCDILRYFRIFSEIYGILSSFFSNFDVTKLDGLREGK